MNNQLIKQIKFARDLQATLGTSNNGPLNDIIDKEMEADFKKEKKKQMKLREQLKKCQIDRDLMNQ